MGSEASVVWEDPSNTYLHAAGRPGEGVHDGAWPSASACQPFGFQYAGAGHEGYVVGFLPLVRTRCTPRQNHRQRHVAFSVPELRVLNMW